MSLGPIGAFFSHYFFLLPHYCIPSYLISYVFHLSFFILSTCFASYPLHPEWWASLVHDMEDSHIISTVYLTEMGLEILSLRRSSRYREFWVALALGLVSTRYRHHPWGSFVHVQGMCICIYVKKNKKKIKKIIIIIISTCVYLHSVLDHWVCILMSGGHFYRVCSLLGVRMWALWDPMLFVLLRHIYLWERWVTFS